MPEREPTQTTNLDTLYGSPPIPWSRTRPAGDSFTAPYSAPSAEPGGATRWRF